MGGLARDHRRVLEALDVAGIDGEERKSLLGEVVNLEQLTGMGIATQTLAVSDNAAGGWS